MCFFWSLRKWVEGQESGSNYHIYSNPFNSKTRKLSYASPWLSVGICCLSTRNVSFFIVIVITICNQASFGPYFWLDFHHFILNLTCMVTFFILLILIYFFFFNIKNGNIYVHVQFVREIYYKRILNESILFYVHINSKLWLLFWENQCICVNINYICLEYDKGRKCPKH